jgi:hypothetical protein
LILTADVGVAVDDDRHLRVANRLDQADRARRDACRRHARVDRGIDAIEHIALGGVANKAGGVRSIEDVPNRQLHAVCIGVDQAVVETITDDRANPIGRVVREHKHRPGERQPTVRTKTVHRQFYRCARRQRHNKLTALLNHRRGRSKRHLLLKYARPEQCRNQCDDHRYRQDTQKRAHLRTSS